MNLKVATVIFATAFSLPLIAQGADWKDISGQEALKLLANKTGVGGRYMLYYGPSGEMKGKWGGFVHTGKYYTNDAGHYCSVWINWDKGKAEGCWSVSRKGNKELKFEPISGRADKTILLPIEEGNKGNL